MGGQLGVRARHFDADGYERREACLAVAECPTCGRDVELIAETEQWVEDDDGRWLHDGYVPATGECCEVLIADWWEGCFVFALNQNKEPSQ